ncbi:hypothetical protein D046_9390, partial [Vibrio parahaemolyticus V-223/04]
MPSSSLPALETSSTPSAASTTLFSIKSTAEVALAC